MAIENIKKFFSQKYEFGELLGRGGFAEVYLATDKLLERKVAVKILLPHHASDPDIVKRFIREARLYAKLDHPNLINIYETGLAEGTAYIVMKFVKGVNLKSFIKKDIRTRLEAAPRIIEALSGALQYIHDNGIIHRDIKPANIIIEEGGRNIYLADFGIARSDSSQTMTITGSIMGTPYYISPEQIKGGKVDQRSDIYALGATLYELITGKPVFSADSSVEILYKHVNSQPEQIAKTVPETPKNLKYIISRCLEKNPERRFQNASEIREALHGRGNLSMTRYLKSVESGRTFNKKAFGATLAAVILVPLLVFLVFKGFNPPVKNDGKDTASPQKILTEPGTLEKNQRDVKKAMDPVQTGKTDPGETDISNRTKKTDPAPETQNPPEQARTVPEKVITPPVKTETAVMEPGRVRFSSFPPSEVFQDGRRLGETTQIFTREFPPGKYMFTYRIEGYRTEEKEVEVAPGKETVAHQRFEPFGFLTLTAKPFARFFLDDTDMGENPIFEKKVPVGSYTVKAVKPGYVTEVRQVRIENLKKTSIGFILKKEEANES